MSTASDPTTPLWTVSYWPGVGETLTGSGRSIAIALAACLRDAAASAIRASDTVAAIRRELGLLPVEDGEV